MSSIIFKDAIGIIEQARVARDARVRWSPGAVRGRRHRQAHDAHDGERALRGVNADAVRVP
jgi:hypothetical protein